MTPTATIPATASAPKTATRRHTLLSDYVALAKPRVSLMVVITAGAGFYLGSLASSIPPFNLLLLKTLIGVAIVTAGSAVLNQALERSTDLLMPRTASRPMAQRRIGLAHGLLLGFALTCLGSIYLAWATNPITGMLTLLTAVGYVGIYTPLKRITTLNTFIGAFPGALPPLIGWTAARGLIEWPAVALFAIIFVWQFPHFMAIGWMYRNDYASAGIRVTSTQSSIDWAARSSALQSLFYAVLMIPVSLWPYWLHICGLPYAIVATGLGLWYLAATIRFMTITRHPQDTKNRTIARHLLKVSVIYLPLLLAAMMLNAQGRLIF
ncbi:heme o synthase [Granulicella paludicola]|uniref:heme o synthase n=1 Tax=Granulicella paludicola TaxID=474951 RepID=UPI0021DF9CF7|nr:heme o synthase [Granulicella paludicola]